MAWAFNSQGHGKSAFLALDNPTVKDEDKVLTMIVYRTQEEAAAAFARYRAAGFFVEDFREL